MCLVNVSDCAVQLTVWCDLLVRVRTEVVTLRRLVTLFGLLRLGLSVSFPVTRLKVCL